MLNWIIVIGVFCYALVAIWCCLTTFRYGIEGIALGLFGLVFSTFIPILGLMVALSFRESIKGLYTVRKETERLGKDLNNDSLDSYIKKIESLKKIPNYPQAWNSLRAAYNMVKDEEELSIEQRKRLKRLLQSKGVSGIR